MPKETFTLHGGFQEEMLERVKQDYSNAKTHLYEFHKKCNEIYGLYHNVKDYVSLKTKNKFPVPYIQETIDQFVADMMDKLYYANRPCQCVGREDTDKDDAEAKQAMIEYQNEYLGMYNKMRLFVKSCAMYRMAVGQVDWWEDTGSEWEEVDMPQIELDQRGIPQVRVDLTGNPIPSGQKQWQKRDYVNFMGAKPKYIRVTDLFYTEDKEETNDEFPLMIRADKSRRFFDAPFFINTDKLKDIKSEGGASEENQAEVERRRKLHYETKNIPSGRPYEYVEWQAPVNKKKLYETLAEIREDIIEVTPGILYMEIQTDASGQEQKQLIEIESEDEQVWAIVGMVNEALLVRLEPNPFNLGCSNIIVGYLLSEDEGITGALSLAELVEAVHKAMQINVGVWIENLKQSVAAGAIINTDALLNPETVEINKTGFILRTNKDVREVYHRVEQPRVSPDILIFQNFLKQTGQDAIGRDEIVSGKGDPATETLGESNLVFGQALLRTKDYLKSFEDSFIIPLWRMRTAVNSEFITQDYSVRVLGEKGYEWRKIKAHQVKAAVDFICESSKREQQKAVLVQQIIEVAQLAPLAIQAGQPVRIDVLIDELAETGFSWVKEKRHRVLPLIAYEEELGEGESLNKMLAENAFLQNALVRLNMIAAAGNALVGAPAAPGGQNGQRKGGVPGNSPKPKTDAEVQENVNEKNQPNIRRT